MTTHDEDEYLGQEFDRVPKVDPGVECNGKKMERTDDGERLFDGYCSLPAGWGAVEGGEEGRRCKLHGGTPSGGAPENNQNATKHALGSDPHHYYQSLPPEGKEFVRQLATTIENRVQRKTGTLDYMDRTLARQVAIQLHIATRATSYVGNESGLLQEVRGKEEAAPLLEEVRQYVNSIFGNLKKLDVLDDANRSDTDSVQSWRNFMEEGD